MEEKRNRSTPRGFIFAFDMAICAFSVFLAVMLRFNFEFTKEATAIFPISLLTVLSVRFISFYISKIYQGIIRYTSSKDAQRIFIVVTAGSAVFLLANLISYLTVDIYLVPLSVLIIEYMSTTFLMIAYRSITKFILYEYLSPGRTKTNIIIYGAGESGIITKQTLDRDVGTKYNILAFIDKDPGKVGKKIESTSILSPDKLNELLESNTVAHLIIAVQNLSPAEKQDLVDRCMNYGTKVMTVPPIQKWINGQLSFKQIKKINIEELLERDPIVLDNDKISEKLKNRIILVTGAAGSIGSELARQIIKYSPAKLILLDQAESPLYDLEIELKETGDLSKVEFVLGDIRNYERMENVFRTFTPEVVFHSAAYKHVPLMENNPSESVLTNVQGTMNVADLSNKYGVKDFVMISTDKAVNPTSVMGASKRIAEIYTQSLGKTSNTKFVTTRFGNVLGSNGSVIPLFKKQIEKGGPVTITHPEITRYFMTITEACQLVLEASAMSRGGEIFIFDMGQSVKIIDLAKKMIRLSGLTLDKDIKIVFTGLRPGEKLFEELLADKENTLPTHHKQIMIARVAEYDHAEVRKKVAELISLFETQKNFDIVAKMKELVPEYRSNNSVYEKLDR